MGAAGLVTEGVGQLIEREAAVQDGAYPRLFERSDIILLLAPAANHKSLQARLLGQQSDGRHFTLQPGQHANQRDMAAYAYRFDGLGKCAGRGWTDWTFTPIRYGPAEVSSCPSPGFRLRIVHGR
jgi:hypothetical protein